MSQILKGTTIITSVGKEKIIIAADSKQKEAGDLISGNTNIPPKCKIRHIDNFFFTADGYTKMITPPIDFLEIIETLDFSPGQSFIEKVRRVELELKPHIISFFKIFQKHNPQSFNSILNTVVLTISFSTFENKEACSAVVYWELRPATDGWVLESINLKNDDIPRYLIQGHKQEIENSVKNDAVSNLKLWDEYHIEELVEIQINSTPNEVGPPVDIVILTPDRYQWIKKKEGCQ